MMPICAGQADRLVAQRRDRHRHQRHAHLLAGRQQHVHFAGGRLVGDFLGQVDQQIGVLAHGADDHDDLVAFQLGANGFSGRGEDLLAIGHAGAAKLLDDDRHGGKRDLGLSDWRSLRRLRLHPQPANSATICDSPQDFKMVAVAFCRWGGACRTVRTPLALVENAV